MDAKTLIKTSRPRFWIYLIGPLLIALAAANTVPGIALYILIAYATLPANLLIYGVNDIFDQETDKLNSKKGSYEVLLKAAQVRSLTIWIIALNLPFIILLAIALPANSLPWLALFLVTGIGYSAPPLRAKSKPFLDAATNVLYIALGLGAYTALSGQQPSWSAVLAGTLWCMAMHAYSAVPDIAADKASHTPTIATVLGARPMLVVCALLYALAGALSYHYLHWFSIVAVLAYWLLMGQSLRVVRSTPKLLKVYALFPYVNTALGMALFFVIAVPKHIG